MELDAFHADKWADPLPKLDQVDLGKNLALRSTILEPPKRSAGALDRRSDSEPHQQAHRVRLERDSGADGLPRRLALDELGAESALTQGDGGCQSRDAAPDDENTFDLGHRMSHFGCKVKPDFSSASPSFVRVKVGRYGSRRLGL